MCGIIGYQPYQPTDEAHDAFTRLLEQSKVRGLHAFGLARWSGEVEYVRAFVWTEILSAFDPSMPTIAHTRYSQSGDWRTLENNQPIIVGDVALAFNGTIHMGTKEEFERDYNVECQADNDGEIPLRLLRHSNALELARGLRLFAGTISGSFAGVTLAYGRVIATRNCRRPLWRVEAFGATWWGSTADIFKRAGFPVANAIPVEISHAIPEE